ncbi:MAG: Fe-S-binding domain-containing protein, partial [Caldilineaceae bacterium]
MTFPLLSVITFLPLLGAVVILLTPSEATKKPIALVWTLATFLISLVLWINWEPGQAGMQFAEHVPWAPEFGLYYFMGVDGISLFLVLLTTFLMPIVIYYSNLYVEENVGAYLALMLALETAMIGVFLALDLVLFFVFFEFSLIPMYFL